MLELSPQMVSAIESGRRAFNGDLEVLGYRNLRLTLPDMSEPMHRARASTAVGARKRAKELLRLAGEVFAELVDMTPKAPDVLLQRLPPFPISTTSKIAPPNSAPSWDKRTRGRYAT